MNPSDPNEETNSEPDKQAVPSPSNEMGEQIPIGRGAPVASSDQPDSSSDAPLSSQVPSGTVVSPGQSTPDVSSASPAHVTVSPHSGQRAKGLFFAVIAIIVIAGLAAGGYIAYKTLKRTPSTQAATTNVDIPELTVGIVNGSVALYPPTANFDSYSQEINFQIDEGLVAYQDQTKIVPLLATGWSNPDSSTWDFNLRHNVTFHDGNTMTAADVVYSLKLAQQNQTLAGAYADTLKDVKALGDYKVEITTAKPDPFFLNKLSFLLILDSRKPNATDTMNGTGPYELKPGTKPTAGNIQLVAYDKYHGGHIYVRQLNFTSEADENSAAADFKNNKVNMVGEFNAESPSQLKGINYQRLILNDTGVTYISINSVSPGPLQKKEVREALRDSIDLKQVIKNSNTAAEPASQMVTQAIPGYNPQISVPKQNITEAKALLAQAGYPKGVSLTLEVSPGSAAVANEVAKEAQAAGFTITVKQQSDFDQLIGDIVGGKTPLAIISFASDVLDGSDVFTQTLQQTADYKSATLDDYLNQAASTIDQAQRLQILQKTSKYLYDDVASIPLFNRQRTWVMDKPYVVPVDTLDGDPGVYFWQVHLTK